MYKDQTILITGGTGSWGNELVFQLLPKQPRKIVIFSRGEFAQATMRNKFTSPIIEFVIGDVRDAEAVDMVFLKHKIDYVFHLAALKHVPICEQNKEETIKTNINGTINLIKSSMKYKVKKFIDVSTDKAVSPSSFYGMTKAIGERLTIDMNGMSDTVFMCVRGGNVLGSNGSVIPHFIKQIKTNNRVTITDSRMTRFFLSLEEAIALLFEAAEKSMGGEIYVMNMPSFYIKDLASIIVEHYGDANTEIIEIGARPGEKMHEELFSNLEKVRLLNDNYFIIDDAHIDDGKAFSSSDNVKDKTYLKQLLHKGGFLI